MNFDPVWIIAALGGGFFGAALGAIPAFVITGITVLAGLAWLTVDPSATFVSFVSFGPIFGPHVAFAGGVAAAAYAGKRYGFAGRDVVTPLAGLKHPDVLLVGALFGVLGHLIQVVASAIPWFGKNTDSVAFSVFVSALIVRFVFGKSGLIGTLPAGSGWSRFSPTDEECWIRPQEGLFSGGVLGLFVGLAAASIAVKVGASHTSIAGFAPTIAFAISATSLMFLCFGLAVPVTHHITLIAGVAAVTFLPIVGGNAAVAIIIGGVFGMLSSWMAELTARTMLNRGDTHIDPPATAIWICTTLVLGLGALIG